MKAWWQLFSGAFTPTECAELVSYALKIPPVTGTVGHGGNVSVNEDMRRCKVRWLRRHAPELMQICGRIWSMAQEANARAFGFELDEFHELQFTEYAAGDKAHYDWHEDNTWVPDPAKAEPFERKLSMVIQLSPPENYTGGELLLERDPLGADHFRDVGDVIFFPSFLRHKVTEVTAGVRHSLVTWIRGPHFR